MVIRSKYFFAISVFLLVTLTWALYTPSLSLPFRDGDQIGYFSELKGSTSLWEGLKLYDYGFSRVYAKGDEILYRPLLFAWLAVQNSLFSYHAVYWNIANLALHNINLILVFFLLYFLQPSSYAFLFTLLLATLKSSMPLALNHHLGGYLLGYGFYFFSLLLFYQMMRRSEKPISTKTLILYTLLTTIACFFYELVIPFSIIGSLFLLKRRKEMRSLKNIFLLSLPILGYGICYALRDFSKTDHFFYVDGWPGKSFLEGRFFSDIGRYSAILFYDLITYVVSCSRWQKIVSVVLFLGLTFPAIFSKTHTIPLSARLFPFSIMLAYLVFLSFMRSGIFRDYYPYLFYYMGVIFIYGLLDFSKLKRIPRSFLALGLLGFVAFNTFQRHRDSQSDLEYYKPTAHYLNQLVSFVDQHKNTEGFSFSIQNPDPDLDIPYELKAGYPTDPNPATLKNTSEILFAGFYKRENPDYVLTWDSNLLAFHAKKGSLS